MKTRLAKIGVLLLCALSAQFGLATDVVWSCSRAEAQPEPFEAIRAMRIDNLSIKDDHGIAITLSDLYGAYGGETIRMGGHVLAVCSLPPTHALQTQAMDMLGFDAQEAYTIAQQTASKWVVVPSIHQMQKCIVENHPAIGFFEDVVENERVGPCF